MSDDSVTPWTSAHQAPLSSTIPQDLLRLMSIELVMLSNHLILGCPHFPDGETEAWESSVQVQDHRASEKQSWDLTLVL